MNRAQGTFSVTMTAEPPYEERGGISLARARFDKTFEGPLTATSVVQMLSARTPVPTSAGYVACERIEGTLDGRQGTFVAMHLGFLERGGETLQIRIVPDSGTADLTGIRGTMHIRIDKGQHFYEVEYTLGGEAV